MRRREPVLPSRQTFRSDACPAPPATYSHPWSPTRNRIRAIPLLRSRDFPARMATPIPFARADSACVQPDLYTRRRNTSTSHGPNQTPVPAFRSRCPLASATGGAVTMKATGRRPPKVLAFGQSHLAALIKGYLAGTHKQPFECAFLALTSDQLQPSLAAGRLDD